MSIDIRRHFTTEETHPFDAIAWEIRDAIIMGKDSKPIFEARGVEFPKSWSQRATDIVASKYFRMVNKKRETSVKQIINRVVGAIAEWGMKDKYFGEEQQQTFVAELSHILVNQYASFNSPVWFNVGVQACPQISACYILDVEDTMESILEWYRQEGMIFKGGSGSGVNLSKIRAKGSPLSNGGTASGVLSFARVADANAGAVKSGGSTRRAAKMLILDADHSEIEEFIQCKVEAERLARHLMDAGYGNGIEGGAYDQVPWQNANNSVSVTDDFMEKSFTNSGLMPTREERLLHKMAQAAWECGDPAPFFYDTINAWHTTPSRGSIVSGNPCNEFLRPPNEACNLASLNLLKFLKDDGSFDIPAFTHTVDIMITAMDIMIDRSSYPTEAIAVNSHTCRPLGLGYCNLGGLLMAKGIPYDSNEGRALAASITALLTGEAYSQSARIAVEMGAFYEFCHNVDAMRSVLARHKDVAWKTLRMDPISKAAILAWDIDDICGYRNCQVTVLAPCGTISFMMDADTTGIEPCVGLRTTKKLVGGGEMTLVNQGVQRALNSIKCENVHAESFIDELHQHPQNFTDDVRAVFATALGDNSISWQGHIKMVAAVQPFLSGGVSKTINMPNSTTVKEVRDAYVLAWKMGLKSISIYRDGSKSVQPVTTVQDSKLLMLAEELQKPAEEDCFPLARRHHLSDERQSVTHKFTINTYEGYVTVGLYEDGSPGELFVRMSKEGSTLGGLMDAWATVMSLALQYGVPLSALAAKFKDGQYEPRGFTSNPEIRTTTSITDYIVRWMEQKFVKVEAPVSAYYEVTPSALNGHSSMQVTSDFPLCSECGNMTMRNGSCCVCTVCGTTTGCS